MNDYDRDMDVCACGHPRIAHDYDADYDEGSWHSYWLDCSATNEGGQPCACESFEENA